MKRTSNMVIKETDESRELELYQVNTGYVWHHVLHLIEFLEKKVKKGTYDHDKAMFSAYRTSTEIAKIYCREFGSYDDWSPQTFDVTARWTAGADLLRYVEEEHLFRG